MRQARDRRASSAAWYISAARRPARSSASRSLAPLLGLIGLVQTRQREGFMGCQPPVQDRQTQDQGACHRGQDMQGRQLEIVAV